MKNPRVTIKVLNGFVLTSDKHANVDEVLTVTKSVASELVASGKAEIIDVAKPEDQRRANDENHMPQFGAEDKQSEGNKPNKKT